MSESGLTFSDRLLMEQNELLRRLVQSLDKTQLGFGTSPKPRYVYANRQHSNCLWYWLNDAREVVPIKETALTGFVEKLEFKEVERRGKDTWKIHLHVRAERHYILEAGLTSNFSKSIISALAAIPQEQLRQPLTIEAQAADSDEVLFCRVYANGEFVFAPWNDQTDFKALSKQAVANIEQAQRP